MRYAKSSTGRRERIATLPRQGAWHGQQSEADAEETWNPRRVYDTPERALCAAVLEDALRVAQAGHPRRYMKPSGSRLGMRYHEHADRYAEAVDWLRDWHPARPGYSLANVCGWLDIDPDVLKRAAERAIRHGEQEG